MPTENPSEKDFPPKKSVTFSVRAPRQLKTQFTLVCRLLGTSVNGEIVDMMAERVHKHRELLVDDETQRLIVDQFAREHGLSGGVLELLELIADHQSE